MYRSMLGDTIGAGVNQGERANMGLRWVAEGIAEGVAERVDVDGRVARFIVRGGARGGIVECAKDGVSIRGIGRLLGDEAGPVREICHGEVGIASRVDRREVKP